MARQIVRKPAEPEEKPGIPGEDPSWGEEGGGGQYPGGPTSRAPAREGDDEIEPDDPTVGPQS
jgi:hypothetical protein